MIIFLYGPDTYRSSKKLKEIIAHYKEIRKSGINLIVLNADENDFDAFHNAVGAATMFDEKRLVVLKEFLSSKDFLEKFMAWDGRDNLKETGDVICVFYEEVVDLPAGRHGRQVKVNSMFAWLVANSKSQEFKTLSGSELRKWAQGFIKEEGIGVTQGALFTLLAATKGDLWAFENEIKKIKFYACSGEITADDLNVFLRPAEFSQIFSLVDAFVESDKSRALKLLRAHIASGDNENYLFSMVCGQFRNIALVADFLENGERDALKIARLCGMHPYVAKKSVAQARQIGGGKVKKIYSKLVDLDIGIKTGAVAGLQALERLIFVREQD